MVSSHWVKTGQQHQKGLQKFLTSFLSVFTTEMIALIFYIYPNNFKDRNFFKFTEL